MEPDAPLLVTSQALQLGHSNLLLLITLFTKAVAFGKRGEVNGFLGIRKSRVEAEKDEDLTLTFYCLFIVFYASGAWKKRFAL